MAGFDLAKTNVQKLSEEGFEFELLLPEINEPTGAYLSIKGAQSESVKKFARKKYREAQNRELQAKKRNKEPEPLTLEEAEEFAIENAAVRLIGWRGLQENGVDIPFNPENASRILKEHTWIRDAILAESDTLANFIVT